MLVKTTSTTCKTLFYFVAFLAVVFLIFALLQLCVFEAQNKDIASFLYRPPAREIRLSHTALSSWVGIGGILSCLKPVLLLSNYTNAVITVGEDRNSGHGYRLSKYIRFGAYIKTNRVFCNMSRSIHAVLTEAVNTCEGFDYQNLERYGLFKGCNTVVVDRVVVHPRVCLRHTQNLVRAFTKFKLHDDGKRTDICVLRRGGDVETKIVKGQASVWAIDEELMLPMLKQVSSRGKRLILVTETRIPRLKEKYFADVLSNKESLFKVMQILSTCHCLFISGGSSFAATVTQIVQPRIIVHTVSRKGFVFGAAPYNYSEYPNAVSVLKGTDHIVNLCAPS